MAKKQDKLDALLFIDTNIFLDFYRIRNKDVSMNYLDEIVKHKDILITSSQVEMEFKKNRQIVILESLSEYKKSQNINFNIPQIISDTKSVEILNASKDKIKTQHKKLSEKLESILTDPIKHDQVYKSLNKVFQNKSPFNLDRENETRFAIRELANKRFNLGYPPRKDKDTSIGDATNWEWIIRCATDSKKTIIIVTRDTDYGASYNDNLFLNDWLRQEFKQRVGSKRNIILTNKLSSAFKMVQIPVSQSMIEEENVIIEQDVSINKFLENFRRFKELSDEQRQSLSSGIFGSALPRIDFNRFSNYFNTDNDKESK